MVRRRPSVLSFVVLAWLPVAAALFRVWVHQDAVQLGYSLAGEEQRREALRASMHELEVEVASAKSPGRLVRVAASLGLRAPDNRQLISGTASSRLARADVKDHHGAP